MIGFERCTYPLTQKQWRYLAAFHLLFAIVEAEHINMSGILECARLIAPWIVEILKDFILSRLSRPSPFRGNTDTVLGEVSVGEIYVAKASNAIEKDGMMMMLMRLPDAVKTGVFCFLDNLLYCMKSARRLE
jgi:hypothetical protein